jgi:hypothetical protein
MLKVTHITMHRMTDFRNYKKNKAKEKINLILKYFDFSRKGPQNLN